MMISRDNYEPYFLDYLEGNLHENNIDQFLDFLEQNPDLKEELHLFENIRLPEEELVFAGKEHLYKSDQDDLLAFERKAVAFMEGDLKDEDRHSFERYLDGSPDLMKEYLLLTKTKQVADMAVQYPDKRQLYREPRTTIMMKWAIRAAAVIVLVWGISYLFPAGNQKDPIKVNQEIALVKPQGSTPAVESKPEKKNMETAVSNKPAPATNRRQTVVHKRSRKLPEQKVSAGVVYAERDLDKVNAIAPLTAMLEVEHKEDHLAVVHSIGTQKINDSQNEMTIEEFLASRAKRVGNQGLLSVQRIFRTGLNVASELSGEHIEYIVENGKVSSIGFESRLLAFSIPLQKK